jgi:hypothetical protein
MAAPNLKSPTTVTGKTVVYPVTASLASVLTNSAASGKVFKVICIRAANVDGASAQDLNVTFYRSSTDTYLAKTVSVPADAVLVVLSKEEYIYLEEGDAIRASAGATSDIELTITYEDIS